MKAFFTRQGLAYVTATLPAPRTASSSDRAVLLFVHANGFCKEIWKPIWEELSTKWRQQIPQSLDLVAFDFSGHGDSRPLPGAEGGAAPFTADWRGVAMGDVEEMLHTIQSGDLQSEDDQQAESRSSPSPSCIYGIGHSLGASGMVLHELLAKPGEFTGGLFLIEPILMPMDSDPNSSHPLADRAARRKAKWSSRQEAHDYLSSRPMFKRWDRQAVEAYIEGGLKVEEGGEATLKCFPTTEAAFYKGPGASIWPQLGGMSTGGHRHPFSPSPPLILVVGEESDHMASLGVGLFDGETSTASKVGQAIVDRMGPKASLVLIPGASHLVTMEQPQVIARLIVHKLLNAAGRLGEEEGAGKGAGPSRSPL